MIMFETIQSYKQLVNYLSVEPAVLVYFSDEKCGVCKTLKPKIEYLTEQQFPNLKILNINAESNPEVTGRYHIFSLPSVLVFFNGKETILKIRNFSIQEFTNEINRYYTLLFDN